MGLGTVEEMECKSGALIYVERTLILLAAQAPGFNVD